MVESQNLIKKNMMQPNVKIFHALKEYILDPLSLKKEAFGSLSTEVLIEKVGSFMAKTKEIDVIPNAEIELGSIKNLLDQLYQNHMNIIALGVLAHQYGDQLYTYYGDLKFLEIKQGLERFILVYSQVPKNDIQLESRFLKIISQSYIFGDLEEALKNRSEQNAQPQPISPIPSSSLQKDLTFKFNRKGLFWSEFEADRSRITLKMADQNIEIDLSKNPLNICQSMNKALSALTLAGKNLITSISTMIVIPNDESTNLTAVMDFLFPPTKAILPRLFLVDEYKLETFLGERGIGPNIYNEHLAPNSSKEIMIKMTETIREKLEKSYNIFDSDSEVAEKRFENQVETEVNQSDSFAKEITNYLDMDKSNSTALNGAFNASISTGGGLKLLSAGASVNISGTINSSENTSTGTSNSSNITRDKAIRNLSHALINHATTASRNREITVTAVTESTSEFQKMESQIETIKNENPDRILIFLVHIMLQEFYSILTLSNMFILFFNGYEWKKVQLPELESFFSQIILDSYSSVKEFLYQEIRKSLKVIDYQDRVVDFHEFNGIFNRCSKSNYFMLLKDQNQPITERDNQIIPFEDDIQGIVLYVDKFTIKQPGVVKIAALSDCCLSDLKIKEYQAKIEKLIVENKKIDNEIKRYDKMLELCSTITSASSTEHLKVNAMFKLIKPNQEIVDKTIIANLIGSVPPKKSKLW